MNETLLIIQLRRLRSGWMEATRNGNRDLSEWWFKWMNDEIIAAGEILAEIDGGRTAVVRK